MEHGRKPGDVNFVATQEGLRPILLHSGFRSGSTWFWNRFRACAGTCAYIEPFNVKLHTLTPERIAEDRADNWPSGHPQDMRPYTEEYLPLLKPDGGVRFYDPRFGIETYYGIEPDPGMGAYVAHLIDHARAQGKRPVLGFCATLGRVEWFHRFVAGYNIVTWRNPRDQWLSCHAQWREHGNFGFEAHYLLVAYIGSLHPQFAPFFADLGPLPFPTEVKPAMPMFARPEGAATRFRVFLRVFMLDTLLSIENADLVVDLDEMSGSASYRTGMTERLRTACALPELDFSDVRLPRHTFPTEADFAAILAAERDHLRAFADQPDAARFRKSLPFLLERLDRVIAGDL